VETALREVSFQGAEGLTGRLSVLPSGPLPPNPSELLSSFRMRDLLVELGQMFDIVVVDSPPLLLVADSLELARMVDGVVAVVRQNRASSDEAREVHALVERLGINLVGVVLTDTQGAEKYYAGYGEREAPTVPPASPPASQSRAGRRPTPQPAIREES